MDYETIIPEDQIVTERYFWECFCKIWSSDNYLIIAWITHCVERFDNYHDMRDRTNNVLERQVSV